MEGKGLKLYGTRSGSFCLMVELALKLKGLPYEYVEEDLGNKSAALLRYNPVHRKVPVLVHDGEPICESQVILHYIDETWSEPPLLLAGPPLRRARVRFWIDFFVHKLMPVSTKAVVSQGEEFTRAVEELREVVKTLEEGLQRDFPDEGPFFGGATPGLLDVVCGPSSIGVPAVEQLFGLKLVDMETAPFMSSRMAAFAELDTVKETMPSRDFFFAYAKKIRERVLASAGK